MRSHRPTTRALGAVLVAVALLAGGPAGTLVAGSAAAAAPREVGDTEATPLSITLTSMTPSQIPQKGVIRITGTVVNDSEEAWSDVNVAPFIGQQPITTRDGLAQAAATAPDAYVGDRLDDPGTYVAVGDLAPGRRVPFTIRMPVSSLGISGAPGVYWVGVHALGSNTIGRDAVADGRARTFIPLVPPAIAKRRTVPVSVVLPLRERARRAADGSLNGPPRWVRLTGPHGRLRRLADFGASAVGAPVTWLVDPAVLDALDDFSRGNPPLSLGSKRRSGENAQGTQSGEDSGNDSGRSGGPSPTAEPSPSPSAVTAPGSPSATERARAGGVLTDLVDATRGHPLLRLGYADPDVVSLARRRPSLIRRADDLAARRLRARGLTGAPTVAPPDGHFDPELLSQVSTDSLMLLGDQQRLQDPPASRLPSGQQLVLTDDRTIEGGPAPTAPRDPLALRQRILSDAALEATKGDAAPRPVVVSLPNHWNPGGRWRRADFFGGLQTSWLRIAPLPSDATSTFGGELPYDRSERADEIGRSNVTATRRLTHTGGVIDHLLANDNDVADRLTGAALQASAYSARATPRLAAQQVLALDATTRGQMDRVQVSVGSDDFVTLSGGSGSLTVTLVNGMKQPITVGLRARTDSTGVRIKTPDPVSMGPGQRTTMRLPVTSTRGVHVVRLLPVTSEGEATGQPLTFSLRTSQVGQVIWYVIIAGGTLLAVMIVRRIVLRVRDHRWRDGRAS